MFGSLLLAVLPLIPYPQSVIEGTGCVGDVAPVYERDASLGAEAYRLRVADGRIVVTSATEAGAFYARQTLKQLRRKDGTYPSVEIADAPAFSWRGVLLDESRHFWGKEVVKRVLDRMAAFKLNVLHWHLTDSHGWRLQIDRYPELTDRGARRPIPDWDWNMRDADGAVGEYGPYFYTKDEVREILAYAKARHIRIIPEIEIPGHSREVILCHPSFTCLDWGTFVDMVRTCKQVDQAAALCVGNDEVMTFFEHVFDEVCELFPDEYVHIGGDECPRGNWKTCPKCQKRMKDEGLKNEDELQSWVTRRFSAYLAKKGRRIVGWDEILSGGLPEGATVMSWRGAEGGIAAANQGHCAVVCPHRMCYLDYPTGEKDDTCPYPRFCAKTRLPLEKVYSFDPLAGIPEAQHKFVLGSQTLNWGESTWTERDLNYKMWPRTCANAEVVWTGAKKRTYDDFRARLDGLLKSE
ncbi:MAG: beta-N-acetylhexosaminidase [Kiritimatiellae bacterium]|nr:beta-N-acetylhexosaminidase [Kiritimatiellia bacterium]